MLRAEAEHDWTPGMAKQKTDNGLRRMRVCHPRGRSAPGDDPSRFVELHPDETD